MRILYTVFYVKLHNTQTSVCLTVKIETPSAFSVRMRIRDYSRDLNLKSIQATILKNKYEPLDLLNLLTATVSTF